MAEESGPEKYAPADRRAPERRSEENIARVSQQQRPTNPAMPRPMISMRWSGASPTFRWAEIDRVISALEVYER